MSDGILDLVADEKRSRPYGLIETKFGNALLAALDIPRRDRPVLRRGFNLQCGELQTVGADTRARSPAKAVLSMRGRRR